MINMEMLPRRDFLRNAVMLAGAGVTVPLWAAMKYDKNAVLRYFREQASETDAPKSFCNARDGPAALRFSVNHKQTKSKTTNKSSNRPHGQTSKGVEMVRMRCGKVTACGAKRTWCRYSKTRESFYVK